MKLPSVRQVTVEATRTLRRFPFALACAAIGTVVALILVDYEGPAQPTVLFRILFGAILGLPLLTATVLVAERKRWTRSVTIVAQMIGVILLIGYAFSVPLDLSNAPLYHTQRLAMLLIGLCGLVVVGPYLQSGQLNGFWQYGKTLFFRALITGLYSGTLFAGLAIALAALDNLFGIDVPEKRFAELWFSIVGVFGILFFLAGVPKDPDKLDEVTDYPNGLKIFAQYILLPLMFVYLVILYAYLGKIVIQWSWPQGWVSRLTLCFAAAGITTLLLLHPIREKTENMWIKAAARWFWVIMVPPIVMLLLAVTRRVSDYGMTEGRYLGYALGIWLAAMAIYFIASRTKNIKVIPATLALLALLMSFGPWGAFQVSERSQVNRLTELLTKNEILVDAKVQKAPRSVDPQDAVQISSIISYLYAVHGYDRIQGWFAESLEHDSSESGRTLKHPKAVTQMMGVEHLRDLGLEGVSFLELNADPRSVVDVRGYQRMLMGQRFNSMTPTSSDTAGELTCLLDSGSNVIRVVHSSGPPGDTLDIPLGPLADTLLSHYDESSGVGIPAEKMTIVTANDRLKVKVCLRSIQYRSEAGRLRPFAFSAGILYSLADSVTVDQE